MRLEAQHVSFRYDRRGPWVLEDLSLAVDSGERLGLFAPKRLWKKHAGSAAVRLSAAPGRADSPGRRGSAPKGILPGAAHLPASGKGHQSTLASASGAGGEQGRLRPELLEALGIEPAWLDRFPRELSGGELQRFCVARALASGADFLICDEISTMLDVITQAQIWNCILEEAAARKMGLIAVTHNRALADRICTRIYDLSAGGAQSDL